ncbi:MAG: Spy/CpxP family protein refolding chaperone [Bosea sp. (in: a-proteobacteria)]
MKRLVIVAAASLVLFGVAAYAQTSPAPQPNAGSQVGQRPLDHVERRAVRMQERANRRLEKLKTELNLTPAQEPLWATVRDHLTKLQIERREFMLGNRQRLTNAELPDRLDLMSERAAKGAANMRELSAAVKPLWATLDAAQKETVSKNLPGRGGRGEGRGHGQGRGYGEGGGERRN